MGIGVLMILVPLIPGTNLLTIIDRYRGIDIEVGYGGLEFTYEGVTYEVFHSVQEAKAAIDQLLGGGDPPTDPVGTTVEYEGITITKNEDLVWEFTYQGVYYHRPTLEEAKALIDGLLIGGTDAIVYRDIRIIKNNDGFWVFTLEGETYSFESADLAKEKIDELLGPEPITLLLGHYIMGGGAFVLVLGLVFRREGY
jgi:hypothetical protein